MSSGRRIFFQSSAVVIFLPSRVVRMSGSVKAGMSGSDLKGCLSSTERIDVVTMMNGKKYLRMEVDTPDALCAGLKHMSDGLTFQPIRVLIQSMNTTTES